MMGRTIPWTEAVGGAAARTSHLFNFDSRPGAIIRDLEPRRPVSASTAAYGHFGRREPGFTWEETSHAEGL